MRPWCVDVNFFGDRHKIMERVYITGRGMVTPIGDDLASNEAALRSGKSGITRIEEFSRYGLDSQVGGMPNQSIETPLVDRKRQRYCPPAALMSIVAAAQAFTEAGFSLEELPKLRIALVGGTASANNLEIYQSAERYLGSNMRLRTISPFIVPRVMPSSSISNLSLVFGIKGESYDISAACSSSALSIIIATRLIRSGAYDIVLAGGAEQLDWSMALGFCACRALSKKYNETPEKASRPFDVDRDGFVIAGGAAYVVLESERSVRARKARPITLVSGIMANSNAIDMVAPDAQSSSEVMGGAIRDAGLKPEDIDYVNTHGTGTPIGDPIEMAAIRSVMGDHPAINSTKSQTGHMVGATGAAEIIYSSLMLEKGFLSPSVNLDNPDPEFAWADLVREYRPNVNLRHALSNSFAFGGSNAAVVVSRV